MSEAEELIDAGPRDFIRDLIRDDLAAGKHNKIVTRFPPEPNGYLHIGHAKSICLNFGIAEEFIDLALHIRAVFFPVIAFPIPIHGLFLDVDHQAATAGRQIGVIGGDPEIDVHGSAIGMFIQPVQLLIALV